MAPVIICPPFTEDTAICKVRMADDAWNTRDPARLALAYTEDSKCATAASANGNASSMTG